jgi:N-acetylglucosamine transport system substrate-binding protein
MLDAAGVENIFSHYFIDFYGTNQEQLVLWNAFLSGDSSVEELTSSLQDITDRVREDDSITKIVVE